MNCSGSTPMPTRFERWMRSKLARDHGLDAQQLRALGRPVARRAGAVLFAAEDHGRHALGRCTSSPRRRSTSVRRRGWNSVMPPSSREPSALGRDHQVLDAHVGEGAAHHHFVVAAARAVGVEVGLQHAVLHQPLARRRRFLDRTGRRDVVGGDRVAEHAQRARAADAGGGAFGFISKSSKNGGSAM